VDIQHSQVVDSSFKDVFIIIPTIGGYFPIWLPCSKLTRQWKITFFSGRYIFKWCSNFKRLFSIACYFTRGQYLSSKLAPLTSQLAFLLGLSSRWFCLLFAMENACNLFAPPWKTSKWKSSNNSSPLLKNNIWVCAGGTKKQTGWLTYEGYTDMISHTLQFWSGHYTATSCDHWNLCAANTKKI